MPSTARLLAFGSRPPVTVRCSTLAPVCVHSTLRHDFQCRYFASLKPIWKNCLDDQWTWRPAIGTCGRRSVHHVAAGTYRCLRPSRGFAGSVSTFRIMIEFCMKSYYHRIRRATRERTNEAHGSSSDRQTYEGATLRGSTGQPRIVRSRATHLPGRRSSDSRPPWAVVRSGRWLAYGEYRSLELSLFSYARIVRTWSAISSKWGCHLMEPEVARNFLEVADVCHGSREQRFHTLWWRGSTDTFVPDRSNCAIRPFDSLFLENILHPLIARHAIATLRLSTTPRPRIEYGQDTLSRVVHHSS